MDAPEADRLQMHHAFDHGPDGGVCVVRCVGGRPRVGRFFAAGGLTGTLRLDRIKYSTGVVKTAWPADGIATRMTAERLLSSLDDLWYPAMDVLVVLHEDANGTSVLVLDHEERLTVVRMHGGGHGGAGRGQGPQGP
ncbi:hypothetical protein [Streptomyces cinereoruber]|uniref:hypothetical protein n=1 Tax=Streptomyces cinereoruber TaxID=67260 RepID=UPI00365E82C5